MRSWLSLFLWAIYGGFSMWLFLLFMFLVIKKNLQTAWLCIFNAIESLKKFDQNKWKTHHFICFYLNFLVHGMRYPQNYIFVMIFDGICLRLCGCFVFVELLFVYGVCGLLCIQLCSCWLSVIILTCKYFV